MKLIWLALLAVSACGEGAGAGRPDAGGGGADAAPAGDAAEVGCERAPAAADRTRLAVVSHPYTADGSPSEAWEVLSISADGELAVTGTRFDMGRATGGSVAFTPDGAVGAAAQEDGTLGL